MFALPDRDAAGLRCARTVERGLLEYTDDAVPYFQLLAVTEEQVRAWDLPTRPAKASDPEAAKFRGATVELDAIPPDKLIKLVENAIVSLVDLDVWRRSRRSKRASGNSSRA